MVIFRLLDSSTKNLTKESNLANIMQKNPIAIFIF